MSPAVDESAVTFTEGSAADLFTGETAVTLKPAQEAEELSIPIAFEDAVTMSEIAISSPSVDGAIQAGTAVVETEDGEILTLPFDISAPEGVHAMGRVAGQNVVTIDLGKKVPVKKVTITVTRVEGQAGEKPEYATVTQIEFLKDIVSEDAAADTQVKGLAATVGDGEVTLVWDSLPNVTGYTVNYGTSKNALSSSAGAGTNRITLSDLKNNTTYYFQVTAVSGDWSGTPSAILSATTLPASVPGAPSNLTVEPADGALRLNWGSTKDATYYQVYYREQGASEFIVWGGDTTATSAVITGLTNDTVYEVAVKAGNLHGTGPFSATASGTPKKEGFEMPALPETNRIDNSQVTSIVMADPSNVNWSMCPGFNVKTDLTDGDPNTYWIANNYWYNSSITYTFADTHSMNYVLVVPYLDSAYKNRIANYTVTLKGADGQVLATYYRDGVNITGSDYYIFSFPETEGVKSLTLALGEKTGGPRVSISEIAGSSSTTRILAVMSAVLPSLFLILKSLVLCTMPGRHARGD